MAGSRVPSTRAAAGGLPPATVQQCVRRGMRDTASAVRWRDCIAPADVSLSRAYGTTTMRYVFSGIPAIPNIYYANPQQIGTTTGGLKIQLKIKANN